jgi:hypothetical protein
VKNTAEKIEKDTNTKWIVEHNGNEGNVIMWKKGEKL